MVLTTSKSERKVREKRDAKNVFSGAFWVTKNHAIGPPG